MAANTTNVPHSHHGLRDTLRDVFAAIRVAFRVNAERHQRFAMINRLQAMSDAELSARGLTRDRIMHHVFRDLIDA